VIAQKEKRKRQQLEQEKHQNIKKLSDSSHVLHLQFCSVRFYAGSKNMVY